jgi:NMD protein affecting ribosome stability and mRNA decay
MQTETLRFCSGCGKPADTLNRKYLCPACEAGENGIASTKLYRISICHYGENHVFYKHASSEKHALYLAIMSLEQKLKLTKHALRVHILKNAQLYKVTEEKK